MVESNPAAKASKGPKARIIYYNDSMSALVASNLARSLDAAIAFNKAGGDKFDKPEYFNVELIDQA